MEKGSDMIGLGAISGGRNTFLEFLNSLIWKRFRLVASLAAVDCIHPVSKLFIGFLFTWNVEHGSNNNIETIFQT